MIVKFKKMIEERTKRVRSDSNGFSLIELIISMTLLAVVALIVSGLISFGSNMYNRINAQAAVSYKSQLATTTLSEYLVDCTGIAKDGEKIYITGMDDSGNLVMYSFEYNADEQQIYMADYDQDELTRSKVVQKSIAPLSTKVTDFEINVDRTDKSGDNTTALAVTVKVEHTIKSIVYPKEQIVSLKNTPVYVTDNGEKSSTAENLLYAVNS